MRATQSQRSMNFRGSLNVNSSLGMHSKYKLSKKTLDENVYTQNEQEKVFLCTSSKPVETSTTFPESFIGSDNNYELFLRKDIQKLNIFKNFKVFNRQLNQAYLRQYQKKTGQNPMASAGGGQ